MGKSEGKYQSCHGCEVYVLCNAAGFMRDDIPCGKDNGRRTYFNPVLKNCTINNSSLCKLTSVDKPHPGELDNNIPTVISTNIIVFIITIVSAFNALDCHNKKDNIIEYKSHYAKKMRISVSETVNLSSKMASNCMSTDGAVYTNWGRNTCPPTAELVYAGMILSKLSYSSLASSINYVVLIISVSHSKQDTLKQCCVNAVS